MIGRTILHYEIVETLGRGGMGVGGWPCHTLQQARSEKAPGERAYGGPDSIIGGRRTRPAARDLGVATLQGSGSGKPLDVPQDVTTVARRPA